jgi:hypothetical protein
MTSSYKEAQERLLKWCQNVTRNYEVDCISVFFSLDNFFLFFSQLKYGILQVILLMV